MPIPVSFHIGMTDLASDERPASELVREAEVALHSIAKDPIVRDARFTHDLDRRIRKQAQLAHELREALDHNEFQLHYQPKVDLTTGTLTAAEALIRWNHPQRGLLLPGSFIDAAEQSGLITPIGNWVLNEACAALRRWQDQGLNMVRVAVNVSVEQFRTGTLVAEVRDAIEHHGLSPTSLTLEITESVFVTEASVFRSQLDALRDLGVRLALDDFGKGYSSLSYLKHFHFDELKIDYAFIKDMLTDDYSHTVVQTSIQLANSLGAEATSEGIETPRNEKNSSCSDAPRGKASTSASRSKRRTSGGYSTSTRPFPSPKHHDPCPTHLPQTTRRTMTTPGHRSKRATGLPGFDNATNGGLPNAGATLLVGPPGSGKTNLSLQIAAQAAERHEPTVFITFEEPIEQLTANAASFDWGHTLSKNPHLHLLDARPPTNAASSGTFDVEALLNVVPTITEPDQPIWLVLDGIDQLLAYEHDTSTAVQQIRNIQDWSHRNNVTTILTGKPPSPQLTGSDYVEAAKYALPTVIELTGEVEHRHLIRRLRILKYRGSAHATNEIPIILDGAGFHLPYHTYTPTRHQPASHQRMSTGIPRLDDILGGGVYVGSTTLISGSPGTAKTNLALHFVAEAAKRSEHALFVSYDEPAEVIIRDAASIGLDLQPYVDSHTLTFHAVPAWTSVAEDTSWHSRTSSTTCNRKSSSSTPSPPCSRRPKATTPT